MTGDDFEDWLVGMDDRLDSLFGRLPDDVLDKLDYSVGSLSVLEGWVLRSYANLEDILKDSEKNMLDGLACYVGETLRKSAGGVWNIDVTNERNVYFGIPVVEEKGIWVECPVSLVTASTDRRTGNYIEGVVRGLMGR